MTDIRSLLKQTREARRITHPYAKYTAQGALHCTACTQKIASEALWETHIVSAQHKEKVKDVIRESQRKAKRGIASTTMEEEQQEQEQTSRKRVKISEPDKPPKVSEQTQEDVQVDESKAGEEQLPEDFFDQGSKPAKKGVDEDEWKRFQADIAETIQNQEQQDQDEEDEIRRGIVEEFEELNNLEDRVERLKKRRAELQQATRDSKSIPQLASNESTVEDDDAEVEEEWW
jgi:zinc finger protein 830